LAKHFDVVLKLLWGTFFVLTSFYALLASLPYTYYAFIKSAPYAWVPWFAGHHALLYWAAVLCLAVTYQKFLRSVPITVFFVLLAIVGVLLSFRSMLPTLQDNVRSYWVATLALFPIVIAGALSIWNQYKEIGEDSQQVPLFSYATTGLVAAGIAIVYVIATRLQAYTATRQLAKFGTKDIYLTIWSVFSHFVVLVIVFSLLNLMRLLAAKTSRPRAWRWMLSSGFLFALVWVIAARFLESAFSLQGWQVQVYAASLAAALTSLGMSVVTPFLQTRVKTDVNKRRWVAPIVVSLAMILVVLFIHAFIGGADWNGFLLGTIALAFWIAFGACIYRLRANPAHYKISVVLAVALIVLVSYEALQAGEIFWAKPLGSTDDEVQRSFNQYAAQDVSFNLAHNLLGNGHHETCGEACRVMRAYTNIPDMRATFDLKLAEPLVPTSGVKPNIFFIVVDSMRPDYLGAYNKNVTFTPNMDAFAKDSFVIHNAYSPYAGTSLSEPAIWAGALLPHAHYIEPFSRVNSLEKLLRIDGYQMILSEDEVLEPLVPPAPDILRLDKDKHLWGDLELSSTLAQLEDALQKQTAGGRPVFFYSQPKNVHQFATNSLPTAAKSGWKAIPGFAYRISFEVQQVDGFLGQFFSWLKGRGLYDSSIIIVTSDHGDATGELGRSSHSLVLYPEIMRVPLIIHLPDAMRKNLSYDDSRVSSLTDITPSLYYLLGHHGIVAHPLFGRPLFASSLDELHSYHRNDLFLASDVRAAYGVLAENGRYFYATYDSPPQSYLFDLNSDPNGEHNVLTEASKSRYDQEVIDDLRAIGDFYGYKPGISSMTGNERPSTMPESTKP
jgi:arylsulfatase A-like enzyme